MTLLKALNLPNKKGQAEQMKGYVVSANKQMSDEKLQELVESLIEIKPN